MYVKFSFWETVTLLFETLELCFWVILSSPGLSTVYSFSLGKLEFFKIIFENSELSYFLLNFCLSLITQLSFWEPWVSNHNGPIYQNLCTLKMSPSFIKFTYIWLNKTLVTHPFVLLAPCLYLCQAKALSGCFTVWPHSFQGNMTCNSAWNM